MSSNEPRKHGNESSKRIQRSIRNFVTYSKTHLASPLLMSSAEEDLTDFDYNFKSLKSLHCSFPIHHMLCNCSAIPGSVANSQLPLSKHRQSARLLVPNFNSPRFAHSKSGLQLNARRPSLHRTGSPVKQDLHSQPSVVDRTPRRPPTYGGCS